MMDLSSIVLNDDGCCMNCTAADDEKKGDCIRQSGHNECPLCIAGSGRHVGRKYTTRHTTATQETAIT